jgi:hypothetical protein
VEEEGELVNEEFQESKFLKEEFRHEDFKDPSQGFVDWDSLPAYDDDISDEDPKERALPSDLEEEYEEDGFPPMFSGLYYKEDNIWEDEGPTDGIADYNEVDEDLPSVDPNFNDEN